MLLEAADRFDLQRLAVRVLRVISSPLEELFDLPHPPLLRGMQWWAVHRQMRFEGGFQGRTNKLVDGCYSFWVGEACYPPLIAYLLALLRPSPGFGLSNLLGILHSPCKLTGGQTGWSCVSAAQSPAGASDRPATASAVL